MKKKSKQGNNMWGEENEPTKDLFFPRWESASGRFCNRFPLELISMLVVTSRNFQHRTIMWINWKKIAAVSARQWQWILEVSGTNIISNSQKKSIRKKFFYRREKWSSDHPTNCSCTLQFHFIFCAVPSRHSNGWGWNTILTAEKCNRFRKVETKKLSKNKTRKKNHVRKRK